MSLADKIFIDMCKDILENGTSTEGEKVRPHWEDGTPAYTIKKFGVVNRYDLSKEFPLITLRKTALKSATDEMLWIWQQKSNNINDLHSHIWDEWADENGSIGKAYGYQLGVKHQYKEGMMDQVDRVIYDLKNNILKNENIVKRYKAFIDSVPSECYQQEILLYPDIPWHTIDQIQQISAFLTERGKLLDAIINKYNNK